MPFTIAQSYEQTTTEAAVQQEDELAMLDPVTLSSITAAVSVLGNEIAKGIASEASKTAWEGVKKLFGWTSDPAPHEVPAQIATATEASPEIVAKLLEILKHNQVGTAAQLVNHLEVQSGGKVVVANKVDTINM